MESLTKPELLMLFSILEGELEARDLVIDALKVPLMSSLTLVFTPPCAAAHLPAVWATSGETPGLCPHTERRMCLSDPL